MSQQAFQSAFARLVTDAGFRARARSAGESAFGEDLTALERRRLASAAGAHGVAVTASLIVSYRLGKILALLPLTRVLLGNERLARELRLFWDEHPPTSFYALDEALDFSRHLAAQLERGRLRSIYLAEVIGYESAVLRLTRHLPEGVRPAPQRVQFRHDPARLLACLGAGRRPRAIPDLPCVFIGTLADDGSTAWSVCRSGTLAARRDVAGDLVEPVAEDGQRQRRVA